MEGTYQRQEARLSRKLELEKQREEILLERARLVSLKNELHGGRESKTSETSSQSRLSAAIERTKHKIPDFERKVQTLREESQGRADLLRKPYNGELGIGSYEPWQLEDVYFVREFVASWMDEVLSFVVRDYPKSKTEHEATNIAKRFFEELELDRKSNEVVQLSLDIERSILTDVIHEAAKETANEILAFSSQTRNMLDGILLDSFDLYSQSYGQNRAALLSNVFSQMKKEAQRKGNVWSHSQSFHAKHRLQGAEIEVAEEVNTFDGTVLYFHDITPFSDIPDANMLPEQVDFENKESEFWMGNVVDLSSLPLPRRYKGISCSAVSPNNSLIALGTVQGDILIWDLSTFPPRILRISRGRSSVISQLHWSLDSSQVVSLNERGTVQIWSLGDTTSVPYDVKAFEPVEKDLGFKSTALISLLTLEPNDFFFTQGPFSDSKDLTSKATAVAFHPSATLLGKQSYLMVGLNNGNILRLKYRDARSVMSVPQVQPTNGTSHKIGQDIEAELFKSHLHRIVLISFVNNISPMVTVDDMGFINLWEYSSASLTGFGWFAPNIKYRLNMSEVTYEPVVGTQEKVEFADTVKGPSHKQHRLRQEMTQKRRKVQKYINSLHLGKPWKTEEVDDKVTHIYAPKNVPESGGPFHCVTYHAVSGLLALYATQIFRPVEIPSSRFISCKLNFPGTKLVFMLLFPKVEPTEAHVSFVIMNLQPAVAVSKNYIKIAINKNDFVKCLHDGTCSFGLSQAVDATGSEYIVTNVNSNLTAISMTTGNEVMGKTQPGWVGCHLNIKKGQISPASKLQVASTCKGLQVLLYAQGHNSAILLQLKDENTRQQRLRTWRAFQKWIHRVDQDSERSPSMLQTVRRLCWAFDRHLDMHVECFMESLVRELIDDAIQAVDGPFSDNQRQAFHAENNDIPYLRRTLWLSADSDKESVSNYSET